MHRPTEWGYVLEFSVMETRHKWEKYVTSVSLAHVVPLSSSSKDARDMLKLVKETRNNYECRLVSYIPLEQRPEKTKVIPADR